MDRTYNGHQNYNYWNVSLWMNNDEQMYREAMFAIRSCRDKDEAARYLLGSYPSETPDGVKFTFRNIRRALRDM